MSPLTKLPVLAIIGGVALGAAVYFALRAAEPLFGDVTNRRLAPQDSMRLLFLVVPLVAGLGAALLAWLASHLSDWSDSSGWLAAIALGITTGVVAAALGAAFLPDPPRELLMILAFSGPGALAGCTLCWWVTGASSTSAF
jgi:hypothetical protein